MGLLEEKILFILGDFFVKTLLRKTAVNQKNQRGEEEKGDRGFRLFGITVKLFPPPPFCQPVAAGETSFLENISSPPPPLRFPLYSREQLNWADRKE